MSITESIQEFIVTECLNRDDKLEIDANEDLLGKGIIDSMQVLQLVQFIEDEFSITVDDEDLLIENFNSIANLETFVRSKQEGR